MFILIVFRQLLRLADLEKSKNNYYNAHEYNDMLLLQHSVFFFLATIFFLGFYNTRGSFIVLILMNFAQYCMQKVSNQMLNNLDDVVAIAKGFFLKVAI